MTITPSLVSGFNPLTISTSSTSAFRTLYGGSVNFNITNFNGTYFARKFNGAFDLAETFKSYALQPTINQNDVLFDDYFTAILGTSATNETTLGGVIYEKIANYVSNAADPTTCNLNQFYSLAASLGQEIDNFNIGAPPDLQRLIDLFSATQSKVWGARSQYARNFDAYTGHTNLGSMLSSYDVYTTMISAGQKIVINDIFYPEFYELIEVPAITSYASITARGLEYLLSAYAGALS